MTDEIQRLIAAGKHGEAARLMEANGDLAGAQQLYEKIWDFANAAGVAERRGERVDRVRLLIDAKDLPGAARAARELDGAGAADRRRLAEVFERKGMAAEAAAVREALGELEAARELYKKGALPLEAAQLDEALGRPREAGVAYEKFLAENRRSDAEAPAAEMARAEAALGRILGGFGRHEEAVRHLQRALATLPDGNVQNLHTREWRERLIVELAALGLTEGARALLDELHQAFPVADAVDGLEPLDAFLRRRAESTPAGDEAQASLLAGRYRVQRLLGAGGVGRVYLARDRFAERDVAIKVIAAPIDARTRDGYGRFLREARVVSVLKHPNIVGTWDFHEEHGLLVMEYMAGGSLADRLRPDLSPRRAHAILAQLCAGLRAAHAGGVIHRDIKPANVFFSATGEAKLGDFGVAHLQDLGATQTGGFIGTLAYMSPEQITGAKLTFACDIYALGVTTFQMLSGRLPFPGPDFVGQHLGETPPPLSSVKPAIGDGFDALVARMLAKDPAERFATLDELERALARIALPDPAPDGGRAGTPSAEPEAVLAAPSETRYRIEAELSRSARSVLYRGADAELGRPVLIEELAADFLNSDNGLRHMEWLRGMARHGGPHLQRVLRIERREGGARVVYEAPVGPPLGWVDKRAAARVVLGVCRALAALHADGLAHGALAGSILVEETGPTLLVAGRAALDRSPGDDLVELVDLVRRQAGEAAIAGAPVSSLAALAAWARAIT